MKRQETRMYGPNKFKLGLFGLNCSGGLTMTKAPEYWDASFENNLVVAQLAEEAGLEFLLPIGRWHGYGGETDTASASFEFEVRQMSDCPPVAYRKSMRAILPADPDLSHRLQRSRFTHGR